MIVLTPTTEEEQAGWKTIVTLSRRIPSGWTLIGAQMVALHGAEHERAMPRHSGDFDVLVDIRLIADGTERVARMLQELRFSLDDPSPSGVSHRFRSGPVTIDVLAPDGVGARASTVTIPPARTVKVPGGTQALHRTELVDVQIGGVRGSVPRPNLLGAILVKARAITVSDAPDEQRRDLAFLLTLVRDPRAMAEHLRPTERKWLKKHANLADRDGLAWAGLDRAEDGRLALSILARL